MPMMLLSLVRGEVSKMHKIYIASVLIGIVSGFIDLLSTYIKTTFLADSQPESMRKMLAVILNAVSRITAIILVFVLQLKFGYMWKGKPFQLLTIIACAVVALLATEFLGKLIVKQHGG